MAKFPNSQSTPLYEFRSGHTFEYNIIATDSVTKKPIGIISRTEGDYQVKNGQLSLYNIVYYENKNHQYGPGVDLVITDGVKVETNKIELDDKKQGTFGIFHLPA